MKKTTNRRTKKGAIAALSLAGALAITGAFAFLSDSDSAINRFSFTDKDGEQTVDVELIEPNWDEKAGEDILPLDTVVKDPQVVNEGENDVYTFITVLVPTAKEIKLNRDDGTTYTAENVELFRYTVSNDWKEVTATKGTESAPKAVESNELVSEADGRKIILNGFDDSLTSRPMLSVTNLDADSSNVYYTAHTYAYAGDKMTKVESGDTTSPVFADVTMINIADGESVKKTLTEVYNGLTAAEGTTLVQDDDEGTITATTGEGETAVSKVIYSTKDGAVIDTNGNIQYKTLAQLKAEDNINIYVESYAIQADNVKDDVDGCWSVCSNIQAGVDEGDTLTNDFYFQILDKDIGHKSAVKD